MALVAAAKLLILFLGLPALHGRVEVQPGIAVDGFRLGSPIDEFNRLLGHEKPWSVGTGEHPVERYVWSEIRRNGTLAELSAYVRAGRVVQLAVFSPQMALRSGLGFHSPIRNIVRQPGFQCYEEQESAAGYTGNRNIIYAANLRRGVAFAFYHDRRSGEPVTRAMVVFPPGTKLIGETGHPVVGCRFSDTVFNSAKPYTARSKHR